MKSQFSLWARQSNFWYSSTHLGNFQLNHKTKQACNCSWLFLKSCQYPDLCCLSTVRAKVANHRKNFFFQGSKRWRVVTLKGELIDQSGKVIALHIELIVFLYYSICIGSTLFFVFLLWPVTFPSISIDNSVYERAACKESSVRQPRASGFCYRASEFCF